MKQFLFAVWLSIIIICNTLTAQVIDPQTQKYRDDPYGNKTFRKKGVMGGNQIRTLFRNDGQIGSWPDRPSGEWPAGTGHHYMDGCTPIVSTRVGNTNWCRASCSDLISGGSGRGSGNRTTLGYGTGSRL